MGRIKMARVARSLPGGGGYAGWVGDRVRDRAGRGAGAPKEAVLKFGDGMLMELSTDSGS